MIGCMTRKEKASDSNPGRPILMLGRANGGVAKWLRHSVSNLVRSIRVGSNPVV